MNYLASLSISLGAANRVGAAVRNALALAVGTGHGSDYLPMLCDIVAEANKGEAGNLGKRILQQ